ncbi:hypothetical protein FB45DRAFT_945212 [Roridomyces roridus]|uniref:F-box domain-containing protein n=1 Tax=Roridomyces roridus TaxID=1738132 RepID=A0AAD7B3K5_9AGAR|nr:hypothetical protein FB45DRAFT_945212 [Roridomyces roridus]
MSSSCPQCGAPTTSQNEPLNSTVLTDTGTIARCLKLMRTNEPPQVSEMAYIQAVLSKTGAQLADLDGKIMHLKAQLRQLEDERAVLAEYHAENTAVVSPVRRIPPEMLAEIFSWTLPFSDDFDECNSVRMKMEKSPWTLGQVSRRWRAIALATPSLWSLVFISGKAAANSRPMIEAHIQRAHKLKIHFHGSSPKIELFQLLSEHATCWEELDIQINATLAPRLAALRGQLLSLRKLWIRWDNPDSQHAVESLKCFETATSLMAVRVDYGLRPLPVFFPTHQLTVYRMCCPWNSHREILNLSPNIVEARIAVTLNSPQPDGQVVNMGHLQRLSVYPSNVLEYLRAPATTRITISSWEPSQENRVTSDLDTFLYLEGLPDANTTAGILGKYPSITSIALVFTGGGHKKLTAAVDAHSTLLTHGNTLAFPQLQKIYFASRSPLPFPINYAPFLNMLRSRWTALHGAGFITKGAGTGPDPVTLEGLNALRENGLKNFLESMIALPQECLQVCVGKIE